MATISQSVVTTAANTPAASLIQTESLTLTANALLATLGANSTGVAAAGSNTMNILGDVIARDATGVLISTGSNTVTLSATGSVSGSERGISIAGVGNNTINNAGDIVGDSGGISISGSNNTITNSGTIRALWSTSNAVTFLNLPTNGTINNSGTIEASLIDGSGVSGGNLSITNTGSGTIRGYIGLNLSGISKITNSGTISGSNWGVSVGSSADTVVNTGTIRGDSGIAVRLGGGNDVYNGMGGRAIGEVIGDNGNDTLYGGAFVDVLRGGADNDTLLGGGGADTLDGGANNDRYQLGGEATGIDNVIDPSGVDLIWSTISRNLNSYSTIENLTLQGAANINGVGNALGNIIVGNSGNNTLTGNGGNDSLTGGPGADTLNGGADNDTYNLGADNDTVIDTGGTADTITSTATRSLAGYAAIEHLTLLGSANINGTGNGLGNTLFGTIGKNVLKGGVGNDTLVGYFGTDSLFGEAGDDGFLYLTFVDSPANATRDVIYDLDDNGNDFIDLRPLPGVDAVGNITLTPSGANTLVTVNGVGGPMQILLVGTTIGAGAGQVDHSDFVFN